MTDVKHSTTMEHDDRKASANTATPSVSVVVIGRNEGERLVRCLESIQSVDYPAKCLELIYVDSGSTDESCNKAESLGAKVISIQPQRPCAAAGRNAGFRAATFDLIHFLDGDTILDRAWLRKAVAPLSDPSVACVFGRRDEMSPDATVYNFWAHHDWYTPPGDADSCAGDALFRREVLERAKGYDESLIAGEEPDLCYRIRTQQKMRILSVDEPMTLHDMNMTRFGQYWRRCIRTGHAYAEVGGRNAGMNVWRMQRWKSLAHAMALPVAIGCSLALVSSWPGMVWLVLVSASILRNARRQSARVGSFGGAMLYALHHYIAKYPISIGVCTYWLRSFRKSGPTPLIEYRSS